MNGYQEAQYAPYSLPNNNVAFPPGSSLQNIIILEPPPSQAQQPTAAAMQPPWMQPTRFHPPPPEPLSPPQMLQHPGPITTINVPNYNMPPAGYGGMGPQQNMCSCRSETPSTRKSNNTGEVIKELFEPLINIIKNRLEKQSKDEQNKVEGKDEGKAALEKLPEEKPVMPEPRAAVSAGPPRPIASGPPNSGPKNAPPEPPDVSLPAHKKDDDEDEPFGPPLGCCCTIMVVVFCIAVIIHVFSNPQYVQVVFGSSKKSEKTKEIVKVLLTFVHPSNLFSNLRNILN